MHESKHGELTTALRRYTESSIARVARSALKGQEGLNRLS